MNSSKSSTSVVFAASADGKILPPYTVYKAVHLYDSWREGGQKTLATTELRVDGSIAIVFWTGLSQWLYLILKIMKDRNF